MSEADASGAGASGSSRTPRLGSSGGATPLRSLPRPAALLGALLALVLTLVPAGRAQVDTGRLEALEQQVDEYRALVEERAAEIARLDAALAETEAEVTAAIAERDRVLAELEAVKLERDATQARLAELRDERERTEIEIAAAEAELDTLEERIQGLLRNLQRRRAPRFAQIVGDAESIHELQVQNRFLGLLADQDVDLVGDLNALLANLAALQAQLSGQIVEQSAVEDDLSAQEARLEATRAQLQAAVERLDATRAGQQAQRLEELRARQALEGTLADLIEDRAGEEERIRRAREARAAAEARLAERQRAQQAALARRDRARAAAEAGSGSSSERTSEGYFYPTRGRIVLSYAPQEQRSYVAFEADEPRAAVRAVTSGRVENVLYAGLNDGYLVVVNHGDGFASVYSNLRPPVVEIGDRVVGGTLLGYLGGGTLLAEDILHLYLSTDNAFVDPVAHLGF